MNECHQFQFSIEIFNELQSQNPEVVKSCSPQATCSLSVSDVYFGPHPDLNIQIMEDTENAHKLYGYPVYDQDRYNFTSKEENTAYYVVWQGYHAECFNDNWDSFFPGYSDRMSPWSLYSLAYDT